MKTKKRTEAVGRMKMAMKRVIGARRRIHRKVVARGRGLGIMIAGSTIDMFGGKRIEDRGSGGYRGRYPVFLASSAALMVI